MGTALLMNIANCARRVSFMMRRVNHPGDRTYRSNRSYYLIILYQIHPAIQLSYLITITIKRQRVSQSELSNSPLSLLTPAWMIAVGIYVRIETVLSRPR